MAWYRDHPEGFECLRCGMVYEMSAGELPPNCFRCELASPSTSAGELAQEPEHESAPR